MKLLINFLVLFFILLLCYQFFMQGSIVEGLANDSSNKCDLTDPNNLFNAVQWNASEISVLKQRIAELENIQTEVTDLSSNMVIVKEQIHGLIAQQQQAATQLVGNKPLTVTGAGYS